MKPDDLEHLQIYIARHRHKPGRQFVYRFFYECFEIKENMETEEISKHDYRNYKIIRKVNTEKGDTLYHFRGIRAMLEYIYELEDKIKAVLGKEYEGELYDFSTSLESVNRYLCVLENKLTKELRDAET